MNFTEQFIAIADMTAASNNLVKLHNHRPGTLKYKCLETGVIYSMHENGYLRRWIKAWPYGGFERLTCYQLNKTRIVKKESRTCKERIMITDMYDMLWIMLKAVAKYRTNSWVHK